MSRSVIAIFDIGRTNKKFLLFDRSYEVVHQESQQFEEIVDEDGFISEDITAIVKWMKKTFNAHLKNRNRPIRALNFTAYGSTLVHVTRTGKPVSPIYNYWKPISQDVKDAFFSSLGDKDAFMKDTSSPDIGMLNAGLQLYWLKHFRPETYGKIHTSLFLPQYCSSIFTGRNFSELSSLGLHSMIWDYSKERSHDWIYNEKLNSKFPPIINVTSSEKVVIKNRTIKCGIGIQKSAGALIPYLMSSERTYLSLNTGCWSFAMNPFDKDPIDLKDLEQDCFMSLSFRGEPIRTSRVFIGREHDYQVNRICEHFGTTKADLLALEYDSSIVSKLVENQLDERKFFPQNAPNTGPLEKRDWPETKLEHFENYKEAYFQLILDLAYMQKAAIKLVIDAKGMDKIFISGGFSENIIFTTILSSMLPEIQFFKNNIQCTAALGAALVLHNQWNQETEISNLLSFEEIEPDEEIDFDSYILK
ncbi:FGGY family carbohydrate kinase [Aureibacter tunicatorum]|uniref:Sugar (Pentulose or hexulose) kinase n=1 Tax=Aureibacter tunicatorum TaxID=866807 RepID=A0AAE3XLM9_9BACT|nr:FGGY family carbohydrate kinase [Aureibacter tunicatorum]MDR6239177.1 sugar (pentulose or hexulose) kinase [Aureibacter tunicatorum]BDD04897.1 hypothetical protein AUTU_23800 [Aureibacter tunicatorum]